VAPEAVSATAIATAKQLCALNMTAFKGTKARVNGDALRALGASRWKRTARSSRRSSA
jgi:hypothetical protein